MLGVLAVGGGIAYVAVEKRKIRSAASALGSPTAEKANASPGRTAGDRRVRRATVVGESEAPGADDGHAVTPEQPKPGSLALPLSPTVLAISLMAIVVLISYADTWQ